MSEPQTKDGRKDLAGGIPKVHGSRDRSRRGAFEGGLMRKKVRDLPGVHEAVAGLRSVADPLVTNLGAVAYLDKAEGRPE